MADTLVCFLPTTSWMALGIGVGSLVVALASAFIAYFNARHLARQKATLDLIEKFESTEHYRKLNDAFSALRQQPGAFAPLNDPKTDEDRANRRAVKDYLNHYELVGLGIRRKVLGAKFYRKWMGGPFVRDWNAAAEWIRHERWKYDRDKCRWRYDRKVYENFERIACKWSKDAIALRNKPGEPPRAERIDTPAHELLPELIDSPPTDEQPPAQ